MRTRGCFFVVIEEHVTTEEGRHRGTCRVLVAGKTRHINMLLPTVKPVATHGYERVARCSVYAGVVLGVSYTDRLRL